ncbi:uncharacterized protein LOC122943508 [Bufo gargarizans]|uniref:uncharacterized protein LOC122943508 n=1 Tax=Bufo gargarizans TaxID=30331 RepID=UPI001CF4557C|nr:uncharacterized protein LOC122943508 [Bufo gargarizans]
MGNRNSNVSSADEPRDAPSTEAQAPGSANSCTNAPANPLPLPPNPTQATLPDFIVANPTTSSSLMAHLGPPTGVSAPIAHMGERPNSRRCSSDVSDRRYRRRSAACHPRCSRHRSRSARRSHRSARSRSSRWRSPSSSEVSSCSDIAGRSHSRRRRGAHASAARSSRGASRASAVQDPNPPIAPVEPPGPSTTGVPDPSASSFTGGLHVPGPSLGHPAERVTPLIRASVAPRPWTGYGKAWAGWVALAGTHLVHSSVSDRLSVTIDCAERAVRKGCAERASAPGFISSTGPTASGLATSLPFPARSLVVLRCILPCVFLSFSDKRAPPPFQVPARGCFARGCPYYGFLGAHSPPPVKKTDILAGVLACRYIAFPALLAQSRRPRNSRHLALHAPFFLCHATSSPLTRFQLCSVFRRCLTVLGCLPGIMGHILSGLARRRRLPGRGYLMLKCNVLVAGSLIVLCLMSALTCFNFLADSPRPTVCFVGHSYLFWACQRAESRPGGRCLGFQNVEVIWRGLRWSQVLPETVHLSTLARSPVILVNHAGGNDLCLLKVAGLITLIRADLERIPTFFPEVVIGWSEMIPRVTWQGARDSGSIERARRSINARISRSVRSRGGVVIRRYQLEGDDQRLMRPGGVHLNDIRLDIFLSGLQDGVKQALFLLGGGRSAV